MIIYICHKNWSFYIHIAQINITELLTSFRFALAISLKYNPIIYFINIKKYNTPSISNKIKCIK